MPASGEPKCCVPNLTAQPGHISRHHGCSAKQIPVDLPASNHLHEATVIDFEGKFVGCGEPGGQATANCLGGCVSRSIAVIPVSAAQAATSVSTVIKVWFSEVHASKDARKTIL